MALGLEDRSVVATGGGSTIGGAIGLALAREGARITIGYPGDIADAAPHFASSLAAGRVTGRVPSVSGADRMAG